jgi:hypothetical protein
MKVPHSEAVPKPSLKGAETPLNKEYHTKLRRDLTDEIGHLIQQIKAEIEWLDENLQAQIKKCNSDEDLVKLGKLKNLLENTRQELRIKSYELSNSDYLIQMIHLGSPVPHFPM